MGAGASISPRDDAFAGPRAAIAAAWPQILDKAGARAEAEDAIETGLWAHAPSEVLVTLYEAEGLPKRDFGGASDPYVKLALGGASKETEAVGNDPNPDFKEATFAWETTATTLELDVMDKDWASADDSLGSALIARSPRGYVSDESQRRRGCDSPWRRVATRAAAGTCALDRRVSQVLDGPGSDEPFTVDLSTVNAFQPGSLTLSWRRTLKAAEDAPPGPSADASAEDAVKWVEAAVSSLPEAARVVAAADVAAAFERFVVDAEKEAAWAASVDDAAAATSEEAAAAAKAAEAFRAASVEAARLEAVAADRETREALAARRFDKSAEAAEAAKREAEKTRLKDDAEKQDARRAKFASQKNDASQKAAELRRNAAAAAADAAAAASKAAAAAAKANSMPVVRKEIRTLSPTELDRFAAALKKMMEATDGPGSSEYARVAGYHGWPGASPAWRFLSRGRRVASPSRSVASRRRLGASRRVEASRRDRAPASQAIRSTARASARTGGSRSLAGTGRTSWRSRPRCRTRTGRWATTAGSAFRTGTRFIGLR